MGSNNIEKVVKTFKFLSNIPVLTGGRILKNGTHIESYWSQRNLEKGKSSSILKNFFLDNYLKSISETYPVDISNEILISISPSEKFKAVLREFDNKQYLEIWTNSNISNAIDLSSLDIHGNVYTDGEFNSFQWSPDEKKILYIAEEKLPKTESFYKRHVKKENNNNNNNNNEIKKGEEYVFRQDWGEQLTGKIKSIIAQYNIETDSIEILNGIPADVCPAQVIFSPDGTYIIGVAYKIEPRKLGLIYCSNRLSTLFKLDFNGNYIELNQKNKSVKSPRITPDGKTLIWLQREAGGPHASAMSLMKTTLPLTEISQINVVVDVIRNVFKTDNGKEFYGLYNISLPKRCFDNNNRLILSTNQKCTINTYCIEIDTGRIIELEFNEGSQIVLDVKDNYILLNRRHYFKKDQLIIGKLFEIYNELTTTETIQGLENSYYEYLYLEQLNTIDKYKNFTAIYVGPKNGVDKSTNLIIWPHGGPHSSFANYLFLECSFYLKMGFAIVFVNYRGSLGHGQDCVEYLLGRIGKSDVDDCILATDASLNKYPWLNPDKIALIGGSHGGFLVTHLSGQYPNKYKVVVSRNPVVDVASMSIISDIPDWCYVETGYEYTQKGKIDNDILLAMRKASPIQFAHQVKAPTLLQIGSKDLRVPSYQGMEYYNRLKANGVTVRMNLYDDNHPLGQLTNELDNVINGFLWIEKYL